MTRRRRSVPGGGSKGRRVGAHRDLEPPPARPVVVDEQLLRGNLLVAGVEAVACHAPHNRIVDPGATLRESSFRTDRDQVTTKRGSEVSPASASSTASGDQGRVASGNDLRALA